MTFDMLGRMNLADLADYGFTRQQEHAALLLWAFARQRCGLRLEGLDIDYLAVLIAEADDAAIEQAIEEGSAEALVAMHANIAAHLLAGVIPERAEAIWRLADALQDAVTVEMEAP